MKYDKATWYPSLRYRSGRIRNNVTYKPKVAVIHWSAGGGDALAVAKYMKAPTTVDKKTGQVKARSASYHFAIGRPGEVYQLVDTVDTAWHAGDGSFWKDGTIGHPTRVNEQSIGICLCNVGPVSLDKVKKDGVRYVETPHNRVGFGSWKAFEAFTAEQRDSLVSLLAALKVAHPELVYMVGHQDVTKEKGDPGPLFETLDILNDLHYLQITRMVHDWDAKSDTWHPIYAPQ